MRLFRLRRFQWITLALFVPLVALAAPLYLGFPLTHTQLSALRVAFAAWLLVVDAAAVIGFTLAIRVNWTALWRRWGGRMFVLGAYVLLVPFCYMPLGYLSAYLSIGDLGKAGIVEEVVFTSLAVSFVLIVGGLLVALVESGMDPTMPLE